MCDVIVVANHGYNLNDLPKMGPLKQVTDWIKHLDVNGKIVELTDIDPKGLIHSFPLGTQRAANARRSLPGGEGNWYDVRGMNLTAANEVAFRLGADWILKIDTDEVCYADVKDLKENIDTMAFYQWEFAGTVGGTESYLADPPPASPWIDTAQTYKGDSHVWYLGAGAIADHHVERKPTERFHAAHLRESNPIWLTEAEKLEHFVGRIAWRLYTNDYGYWSEALLEKAIEKAKVMLNRSKTLTDIKAPEAAYFKDPLEYIRKSN